MGTVTSSRSVITAVAIGFALGILVELPALVVAAISGGGGHGNYAAARGLFPLPMLLTLLENDSIGTLSISAGLLQFPIYGALLGWSMVRTDYVPAIMVTMVHTIAAVACFTGTLPNFS